MKKLLLLSLFLLVAFPTLTFAQSASIGLMMGRSQDGEDGLNLNFDNSMREVFFSTPLESDTALILKAGRTDAQNTLGLGDAEVVQNGTFDYVDVLIGYKFDEVWGSTTMFAGPGFYRQKFGTYDETDFGIAGGINGVFPVSRRFALLAEAAYHWTNFEQRRQFVTIGAGFQVSF